MLTFFAFGVYCVVEVFPNGSGSAVLPLKKDEVYTVSLEKRNLFVIDAAPDSFWFAVGNSVSEFENVRTSHRSPHLLLSGANATLSARRENVSLNIWLVPDSVCGGDSVVLGSSYSVSLRAMLGDLPPKACIFSKMSASAVSLTLKYDSDITNVVNVYEFTDQFNEEKRTPCVTGQKCNLHGSRALFISLEAITEGTSDLQVKLKYSKVGKNTRCSLAPVVSCFVGGQMMGTVDFLGPKRKLSCRSFRSMVFQWIALALAVVLLIMQLTGAINVTGLCFKAEEEARFQALKSDPYASEVLET
jgi:hypothetical protein